MKITEVFKAKNVDKEFKMVSTDEVFELVERNGVLVLRNSEDLTHIEKNYTLHIILASEFEEVPREDDDMLDLDGFVLDDEETIQDDILALLLG